MSRKCIDLTGHILNSWKILGVDRIDRVPNGTVRFWSCQCLLCGNIRSVSTSSLNAGHSKSCGCARKQNLRHGLSGTREFAIWNGMIQRCTNSSLKAYYRYGGRGITVCERWMTFVNFYADMGPSPTKKHSIDRYPNKDGNYEPGNCRWATWKEQQRNKRNNRFLTFHGQTRLAIEWAEIMGLSTDVVYNRLKAGWSVEDVIMTPCKPCIRKPRQTTQNECTAP